LSSCEVIGFDYFPAEDHGLTVGAKIERGQALDVLGSETDDL